MNHNWILSNKPLVIGGLELIKSTNFCKLFSEPNLVFKGPDNLLFLIDGYIIPRKEYFHELKHLSQKELVICLYEKCNIQLIKYIKGVFSLIIITSDHFVIFNDRHSIKKFFIYNKEGNFIISNNLGLIADNCALELDKQNVALFCLFEHFIDGITLFKNLSYSKPATQVIIKENISITNYWNPEQLLNNEIKKLSFLEMSLEWKEIVEKYIDYLRPSEVTMTLTGGNDSRMILAALLSIGIKPNAFTFGNPQSYDCMVAKKIADRISLNYHNYYVSNPSPDWFKESGQNLISLGNSLINIHRAHRLDAIKEEMNVNPLNKIILGGFMGGDYIKGINYDDYITAKIVRLWEYSKRDKKEIVKSLLKEKYFNINIVDIEEILEFIYKQKIINQELKINREFQYVYNVIGAVHDVQDINVFSSQKLISINPFMDDNFVEMLFSSHYSMLFKTNSSKNQLKRLNQPALQCNVINILAPELSNIEFSKGYSPEEFLGNKVMYLIKRFARHYFGKKYPSNFSYKDWIIPFVSNTINNSDTELSAYFDLKKMQADIIEGKHQTTEGYWHKYTDYVNINYIAKEYLNYESL